MNLFIRASILSLFSFAMITALHAQTDTSATSKDTATNVVQVQAKFPGGVQGWAKYLQQNLRSEVGAENLKVKKHQTVRQTAIVSFLVNKEGKISEVTVTNPAEVHPALAAEAVRVIKEGPGWLPATINGQPVIYRQKQAITFEVTGR